jgi:hypothetical protein
MRSHEAEENPEAPRTKNIVLSEFVSGNPPMPDGTKFIALCEQHESGSWGAWNLHPISWGNDQINFTAEGAEYTVHALLVKIQEEKKLETMEQAVKLLMDAGEKGVDMTMTNAQWEATKKPFDWHLPWDTTLNIPHPSQISSESEIAA